MLGLLFMSVREKGKYIFVLVFFFSFFFVMQLKYDVIIHFHSKFKQIEDYISSQSMSTRPVSPTSSIATSVATSTKTKRTRFKR